MMVRSTPYSMLKIHKKKVGCHKLSNANKLSLASNLCAINIASALNNKSQRSLRTASANFSRKRYNRIF